MYSPCSSSISLFCIYSAYWIVLALYFSFTIVFYHVTRYIVFTHIVFLLHVLLYLSLVLFCTYPIVLYLSLISYCAYHLLLIMFVLFIVLYFPLPQCNSFDCNLSSTLNDIYSLHFMILDLSYSSHCVFGFSQFWP